MVKPRYRLHKWHERRDGKYTDCSYPVCMRKKERAHVTTLTPNVDMTPHHDQQLLHYYSMTGQPPTIKCFCVWWCAVLPHSSGNSYPGFSTTGNAVCASSNNKVYALTIIHCSWSALVVVSTRPNSHLSSFISQPTEGKQTGIQCCISWLLLECWTSGILVSGILCWPKCAFCPASHRANTAQPAR